MKKWMLFLGCWGLCLAVQAQDYPDINSYIFVDKEPQPVNLGEVRGLIGYPEAAIEAGVEGAVVARVLVDQVGDYLTHQIIQSSDSILQAAVSEHVGKLRFTPAVSGDSTLAHWINIPFRFQLEDPQIKVIKKEISAKTDSLTGDPENFGLWQRRGVLYTKLEQWEDAVTDFTESITLNPRKNKKTADKSSYDELFYAHYGRAVSYTSLEKYVEARQDFDIAEQLMGELKMVDPEITGMKETIWLERGYILLLQQDYAAARPELKKLVDSDSSMRCTAYQLLAEAALDDTLPAERVFAYEGLASCKPDDILLRYSLGYYRSEAADYEAAIKDLAMVPAKTDILEIQIAADNRIGWCYLQMDQYEKALAAIEKGKDRNVVHPQAYYYEALVYLDQGMTRKGCEALGRSINFELAGQEGEDARKLFDEVCGEEE